MKIVKSIRLGLLIGWRYRQMQKSQFWNDAYMERFRRQQLLSILEVAVKIPFYQERLLDRRNNIEFSDLPILKREDVHFLNQSVRSIHPVNSNFLCDRSSGSTGMPREFLFDASHQRSRFAARTRYLVQNGWTPFKKSAWIVPIPTDTPDGRLMKNGNLLGSRFLSLFTQLPEQVEWLLRFEPEYLYTLPSNLEALYEQMNSRRIIPKGLKRIFTGGEVLEETLREKIWGDWNIPISDNYGSTEGFCSWECSRGLHHINSDHLYLEILDQNDRQVKPGETGRIVITTLENFLMPLIRYEIGDYGIQAKETLCECGRTLPLLGKILGRSINMFRMQNGTIVSPWEIVVKLKHIHGIHQFQIIQKTLDSFIFRTVSSARVIGNLKDMIANVFRDVLNPEAILDFEFVDEIQRTPSGKFMTAISEI